MDTLILTYIITLLTNILLFFTLVQHCNYYQLPKRSDSSYKGSYYLFIILSIAFSFCSHLSARIIYFLSFMLFIFFSYSLSPGKYFFHIRRFYLSYSASYIIIHTIFTLVPYYLKSIRIEYTIYNQKILHVMISMVMYLTYTLFTSSRLLRKERIRNPYHRYIAILFMLISLLLSCFILYSIDYDNNRNTDVIVINIVTLSIVITIFILIFYNKMIEYLRQLRMEQLKHHKYEIAQSYYDELMVKTKQLSSLRHDFNNHLGIIQSRLEAGEYEQAIDYLISLTVYTNTASDFVITNNPIISSIIQTKKAECDRKRIQFEYEAQFDKIYNIGDLELIIILGNILDNAIDATEKVNPKDRAILLTLKQINTYFVIQCINPYVGELQMENGKLVTTKKDTSVHGIGLLNVMEVCEKYGGECTYTFENNIFTITILLPNY